MDALLTVILMIVVVSIAAGALISLLDRGTRTSSTLGLTHDASSLTTTELPAF